MGFLNPKDHVEGGVFLDNVTAVTRNARWELWDAKGNISKPVVALAIDFEVESGDVRTEYWGMGKNSADNFAPSDDGLTLEKIGENGQMTKSCKASIFLTYLCEKAGFDGDRLDEEPISCISNMKVKVIQIDPPKSWSSMTVDTSSEAKAPGKITVISKILEEDVEETVKPSRGKGKAKPVKKAKPVVEDDDDDDDGEEAPAKRKPAKKGAKAGKSKPGKAATLDLDEEAERAIVEALEEAEEGYILGSDIPRILAESLEDNPYCTNITAHAFKKKFYTHEDRPWIYDPEEDSLTMPEE